MPASINKNAILRLRWACVTVAVACVAGIVAASGRMTVLNDRSCGTSERRNHLIRGETHEEKRVCEKGVNEHERPKRTTKAHEPGYQREYHPVFSMSHETLDPRGGNPPDELVAPIGDEIHDLRRARDVQDVAAQLHERKVEQDDDGRAGCRVA
jgi:hypothetical protein